MREIIYIASESRVRQGKKEDLIKKYPGWNIRELGGGNGNWLLTKNSDVLVDGVSYRKFVLEHYKKKKLTENLVNTFRNDVNTGALVLPDCMEVSI